MGAEGTIEIYDYDIVRKIELEINTTIKDEANYVSFPGYICDWTCNDKNVCFTYFGENTLYEDDFDRKIEFEIIEEVVQEFWKLFKERCHKEASLLFQEVWT